MKLIEWHSLSNERKRLLFLLGGSACFILIYLGLVKPITLYLDLKSKNKELSERIIQLQEKAKSLEAHQEEINARLFQESGARLGKMDAEASLANLLGPITKKMELQSVLLENPPLQNEGKKFEISVISRYEDFIEYLKAIENELNNIAIDEFTMTKLDSSSNNAKVDLLELLKAQNAEEKLRITFGGRIIAK